MERITNERPEEITREVGSANRKEAASIIEQPHCWHENISYGHTGFKCCYCGIRWWEGMKTRLEGHGPFAPDSQLLPRPNKACAGPETRGKVGRAATAKDVDFTLIPDHAKLEAIEK